MRGERKKIKKKKSLLTNHPFIIHMSCTIKKKHNDISSNNMTKNQVWILNYSHVTQKVQASLTSPVTF